MPTFEVVPLAEAIEATKVDTWLEYQFGQEHGCDIGEGEDFNGLYIIGDRSGGVYKDSDSTSIFSLEEAVELANEIKLLGGEASLYRIVPVEGSYEARN